MRFSLSSGILTLRAAEALETSLSGELIPKKDSVVVSINGKIECSQLDRV